MAKPTLTAEYVRSLLDYDPDTGRFVWKRRPREHYKSDGLWRRHLTRWAGKEAGNIDPSNGYRKIKIDNCDYRAHRLAWLIVHGQEPCGLLDHINGVRDDNRIGNLREVDRSQSNINRMGWAKRSLPLGVYAHEGKFAAKIQINGRSIHLGRFGTVEQALVARQAAAKRIHGEYARK